MNEATELNAEAVQAHICDMQKLYAEWQQLLPKFAAAQEDWQRGMVIMQQWAQFYFSDTFRFYTEAVEQGLAVDLRTQGEYSVMSEDAIWNALAEQDSLAWQRLRSAMAVLDREAAQQ